MNQSRNFMQAYWNDSKEENNLGKFISVLTRAYHNKRKAINKNFSNHSRELGIVKKQTTNICQDQDKDYNLECKETLLER